MLALHKLNRAPVVCDCEPGQKRWARASRRGTVPQGKQWAYRRPLLPQGRAMMYSKIFRWIPIILAKIFVYVDIFYIYIGKTKKKLLIIFYEYSAGNHRTFSELSNIVPILDDSLEVQRLPLENLTCSCRVYECKTTCKFYNFNYFHYFC